MEFQFRGTEFTIDDLVQLESVVKQHQQMYEDQVEVRTQIVFTQESSAATLADALKAWHATRCSTKNSGDQQSTATTERRGHMVGHFGGRKGKERQRRQEW